MKKGLVILFDLDGTLIDSTDAIVDTFFYVFEYHNFEYKKDSDTIKDLIGYPLPIMFERLGVDKSLCEDYTETYRQRYRLISKDSTILLQNAIDSLNKAQQFARLSVVTTKTAKYTKPLLEHLGILDYFEYIIGAEDVTNCKPHSEPIDKVLSLMDINKTNFTIWMIGDTKLDLIASNRAGIGSIGVLTGYGKKEELEQYTPYVVGDCLEAVKLIIKDY
jgi:HAD superfamily hydrolase (TIGR01549 family)